MDKQKFENALRELSTKCSKTLVGDKGEWIIKGFVDVLQNVYSMPGDTKVVSQIVELMLLPTFAEFAKDLGCKLVLPREQNHYPDLTFVFEDGTSFAVDMKTTYRIDEKTVNTMTLGAFTGYFRERASPKNTTLPYGQYAAHLVFGVVYSRNDEMPSETQRFSIEALKSIPSVIHNLDFFVQPKFKIAKDQPGSGNTKNIGAISRLSDLVAGKGPFASLGEHIFDDYWMHYLTKDMARAAELAKPPYNDLDSYFVHKKLPIGGKK